jgi:hypothetical protein
VQNNIVVIHKQISRYATIYDIRIHIIKISHRSDVDRSYSKRTFPQQISKSKINSQILRCLISNLQTLKKNISSNLTMCIIEISGNMQKLNGRTFLIEVTVLINSIQRRTQLDVCVRTITYTRMTCSRRKHAFIKQTNDV